MSRGCLFRQLDNLPQVSVQVLKYSVLVLYGLEYHPHHVRAVAVAVWRVRTCTSTHVYDHPCSINQGWSGGQNHVRTSMRLWDFGNGVYSPPSSLHLVFCRWNIPK